MKAFQQHRGLLVLFALLTLTILACGTNNNGIPNDAVVVNVLANTSASPWIAEAAEAFNETETETEQGNPVYVVVAPLDAGQAVVDIEAGAAPTLWVPDAPVWADLLTEQGTPTFSDNCVSLAESPLVIAVWRPVAESLGWPGRELGWLDIGSLAADESAWDYYSGGQFGDALRLGHTHPGLSASGASTLLALVQAAESQSEAVSVDDIEKPIVQASVGAFESAVSWFSTSTGDLARTMAERGIAYLGAGVMYESDVIANGTGEPAIVPVYPFEGTFVATHPGCISSDLDAETTQAATLFRDYLLSEAGQELALSNGLRPVNPSVPLGPPLTTERGFDPEAPAVVFADPSVDTVYAVQDLWSSARKPVNLVMLVDVSGSMRGPKIENVRTAAQQFIQQMGDDDYLSIIAFSTFPERLVEHQRVGDARSELTAFVASLEAAGDTALNDAIEDAAALVADTTTPETTNVIVVLSDGQDTSSFRFFDDSLIDEAAANATTVFAIAYGDDANNDLLERLALRGNGNFFLGDEASIGAIYEEMSAAFGGSVGVGR